MKTHSTGRMLAIVAACLFASSAHAADRLDGKVSYKSFSSALKHGFMVASPGDFDDPSPRVLRLYLSSADIGAAIKACKTLSCADHALHEGVIVDFGDSSHLPVYVRLNNEKVQLSGSVDSSSFKLSTQKPDHLAGKLYIDSPTLNGVVIDADFDLGLANTFQSVR